MLIKEHVLHRRLLVKRWQCWPICHSASSSTIPLFHNWLINHVSSVAGTEVVHGLKDFILPLTKLDGHQYCWKPGLPIAQNNAEPSVQCNSIQGPPRQLLSSWGREKWYVLTGIDVLWMNFLFFFLFLSHHVLPDPPSMHLLYALVYIRLSYIT